MDFKLNILDKSKQEVEFDVPYQDLSIYFEKALNKFRDKATISGFRKGKAPISIIKRKYGSAIEYDALEEITKNIFEEYVTKNDVKIIGQAKMNDMHYEPSQYLKFKIQYEIIPVFELTSYKGLELTKNIYLIDDEMVDDEIKYIRQKYADYKIVEKASDNEHIVTLDFQLLDDSGLPVIGQVDKGIKVYLNDEHASKELIEQLSEISLNEERIIMLSEGRDKTVKYLVKTVKIENVIQPELNELFFNRLHKHNVKTVDDFRIEVKKDIERVYDNISEQELKNNVISELIKSNDIPVPEYFVEKMLDGYLNEIKNRNAKHELPKDFSEDEFRKTRRAEAIKEVKWFLIKDKLIDIENISVSESEINAFIEQEAEKYNIPADKFKTIYEANTDAGSKLLSDKLMDLLLKNAKVNKITTSPKENINQQ